MPELEFGSKKCNREKEKLLGRNSSRELAIFIEFRFLGEGVLERKGGSVCRSFCSVQPQEKKKGEKGIMRIWLMKNNIRKDEAIRLIRDFAYYLAER